MGQRLFFRPLSHLSKLSFSITMMHNDACEVFLSELCRVVGVT